MALRMVGRMPLAVMRGSVLAVKGPLRSSLPVSMAAAAVAVATRTGTQMGLSTWQMPLAGGAGRLPKPVSAGVCVRSVPVRGLSTDKESQDAVKMFESAPGKRMTMRELLRAYGFTALLTYLAIDGVVFGAVYAALAGGVDVVGVMQNSGAFEWLNGS
jgi:hypothetical protein